MVNKLPGVQESGLNPKSISKIEYLDAVTKDQVCIPLTDPKIIDHPCTKKRHCEVCKKMIWKPVPSGPRDLVVVYTYRPYQDTLEFEDSNPMFRNKPLKGMVLIESFSGTRKKGAVSSVLVGNEPVDLRSDGTYLSTQPMTF